MWKELPEKQRSEYKRMILAFASLTEMFAQKNKDSKKQAPVLNSKFQESLFQKVFGATGEDIGNTAYDASLEINCKDGIKRFLIGLKTFLYSSNWQKVAQFKGLSTELSPITSAIDSQSNGIVNKEEINNRNKTLYLQLAQTISHARNMRVKSAKSNIKGFSSSTSPSQPESVYHVLMPGIIENMPKIVVGETSYDEIDINNIRIIGCTTPSQPSNFTFTDSRHDYRYTNSDSQLLMDFNNKNIEIERWDVRYLEDPYDFFAKLADEVFPELTKNSELIAVPEVIEAYEWPIGSSRKNGEVEQFSGFNSFYAVGSKLAEKERVKVINQFCNDFEQSVGKDLTKGVKILLTKYLLEKSQTDDDRSEKVRIRQSCLELGTKSSDPNVLNTLKKILFRPIDELYIPIPNSKKFHEAHPDFFGKSFGTFVKKDDGKTGNKLAKPKDELKFNLVFEPSKTKIEAYISQDNGKAIMSTTSQKILGHWILREIFQLDEYEPLTKKRLDEIGINGLLLYRVKEDDDVHLEFIWRDEFVI